MYRSQLILQQMGIRQWIPKSSAMLQQDHQPLWRDQAHEAAWAAPATKQLVTPSNVLKRVDTDVDTATSVVPLKDHKSENSTVTDSTVASSAVSVQMPDAEVVATQHIQFEFHLIIHEKFVILAEIANTEQHKLFHQIAQVCYAEQALLKWPLGLDTWDMNDQVVAAYLAGFEAYHQDKKLICLGAMAEHMESLFKHDVIQVCSLETMLQSADAKRQLWQLIYPLIYDLEDA